MTRDAAAQPVSVSVAIATRNRPEMVDRCLAALVGLPTLPDEIVIVDQSSDEKTARAVQAHAHGPARVVYEHQAASGLGKAQNLAMALARCDVVAVTDDDCVPAPDWVAVIRAGCGPPNGSDVITGTVLPLGPDQPDAFPVATRTSTVRAHFDARALPWEIGSGNNFAVRRAWLAKVGGNDERLGPGTPGRGGVDMDLFYQLSRAGARILYDPGSVVYHERASKADRLARRGPYGYGMGACCGIWLRAGDGNAWRVLAHWLRMRSGRLVAGLARADGLRVREEAIVLAATFAGLAHGWRVGRQPRGAGLDSNHA